MIAWAWTALLLGFGLGLFTASRLRAGRTEDLLRERDALKADRWALQTDRDYWETVARGYEAQILETGRETLV